MPPWWSERVLERSPPIPVPGTEPLLQEPGLRPATPELLDGRIEHVIERENVFGFGCEFDFRRHGTFLSKRCRRPPPPGVISWKATQYTGLPPIASFSRSDAGTRHAIASLAPSGLVARMRPCTLRGDVTPHSP